MILAPQTRPQASQIKYDPSAPLISTDVQSAITELIGELVTDLQIADGSVTTPKLAPSSVTSDKLATGAAIANIGVDGITATQLAAGSITTSKFDSNAKAPFAGAADTATTATTAVTATTATNATNATNVTGSIGSAVTATTQTTGDDTTKVATTEFVRNMGLGWDQTWQDVTSLRALDTNYTNTTGKPIMVQVRAYTNGSLCAPTVGGVLLAGASQSSTDGFPSVSFIVPPGATYSFTAISLARWVELR